MNDAIPHVLEWLVSNAVLAGALAGVLLASSRWLERRPAVGGFGWMVVLALAIAPPIPQVWSPGLRDRVSDVIASVTGVLALPAGEPEPKPAEPAPVAEIEPSLEPIDVATVEPAKPVLNTAPTWSIEEPAPWTSGEPMPANPARERSSEPARVWTPEPAGSGSRAIPSTSKPAKATESRPTAEPARPMYQDEPKPTRSNLLAHGVSKPARAAAPVTPVRVARVALGVLAGAWVLGFALVAGRQFRRLLDLKALEQGATNDPALQQRVDEMAERLRVRSPRAIRTPGVRAPMVWSIARPTLIWPAEQSLDAPGVDGMIAHELAHLRRGDHWFAWFELLAITVFWWHPVVWLAHKRARAYAELACDAWVSWALPESRRAYAEALVEAVHLKTPRRGPALAFGVAERTKEDFSRRLTMVMTGMGSRRLHPLAVAAGLGLVFALTPRLAIGFAAEPAGNKEVIAHLDSSVRSAVERATALRAANRAEDADDTEQAIKLYQRAIELGADDAWEDVAMLQYEAEAFTAARGSFVKAAEHDGDEDDWYNAACCAALAGDSSEALRLLERAVAGGYDDADHMRTDSDLESVRDSDRFDTVAAKAEKAEQLDDMANELTDAAAERDDQNAWRKAAKVYAELGELQPENETNVHMAAYCAIMGRDFENGEHLLRRQLDKDIAPATACYNMACLEALRGDKDAAIGWLFKAADRGFTRHQLLREDEDLASVRDDPRFREALARVARPERARRELELAAEFGEWEAVVDQARGVLADLGADDKRSAHIRDELARAYQHLGRYDDAINETQKMIAAGGDLGDGLVAIARADALAGRVDEGAWYLAAAIDAGADFDHDKTLAALNAHPAVVAARERERTAKELAQFDATSWEQLESRSRDEIADGDTDAYLTLGWALLRQHQYKAAADAFTRFGEDGNEGLAAYNVACCLALMGQTDGAFEHLDKALANGFGDADNYMNDPDLASLRDDPRWKGFMERVHAHENEHDHHDSHDKDGLASWGGK